MERQLSHSLLLSSQYLVAGNSWMFSKLGSLYLLLRSGLWYRVFQRRYHWTQWTENWPLFWTEVLSIEASFHISNMVFFCKEVLPLQSSLILFSSLFSPNDSTDQLISGQIYLSARGWVKFLTVKAWHWRQAGLEFKYGIAVVFLAYPKRTTASSLSLRELVCWRQLLLCTQFWCY